MDQSALLMLLTVAVGVLLILGLPFFLCLFTWAIIASFIIDFSIQNIVVMSYQGISSYSLLAVPLLVLIGETIDAVIRNGKPSTRAADPPGRTMNSETKGERYNSREESGGGVGIFVAPIVLTIIYGFMTRLNIINLLTAGWGPAICLGLGGMAGWGFCRWKKNKWGGSGPSVIKKSTGALLHCKLGITAILLFLVLVYSGFSSPIEAASVVSCFCIFAGVFATEKIKLGDIPGIFMSSGRIIGVVVPTVAASVVVQQILTIVGISRAAYNLIYAFQEPWIMMLLMMFVLIFFGSIMESISTCIILAPVMAPIAASCGYNPYHFALVFIVGLSLAFITPPLALGHFVTPGVSTGIQYGRMGLWTAPLLVGLYLAWLVIAFYPPITLTFLKILGGGGF